MWVVCFGLSQVVVWVRGLGSSLVWVRLSRCSGGWSGYVCVCGWLWGIGWCRDGSVWVVLCGKILLEGGRVFLCTDRVVCMRCGCSACGSDVVCVYGICVEVLCGCLCGSGMSW